MALSIISWNKPVSSENDRRDALRHVYFSYRDSDQRNRDNDKTCNDRHVGYDVISAT